MSIKLLHIRGFRSLRDIKWQPGNLNVVIGPNGSGKSNLLRALQLLSRASTEVLDDYIVSQGGMYSILWDHRARLISFELHTDLPRPRTELRHEGKENLRYAIVMEPYTRTGTFRIRQEVLDSGEQSEPFFARGPQRPSVSIDGTTITPPENQPALALAGSPTIASRLLRVNSAQRMRGYLSSWRTYHDIRVDQDAELRKPAIARYERTLSEDGQNLIGVLHTLYTEDPAFEESIDAGMRAGFGTDYKKIVFPPAADQRVQLRIRVANLKMAPSAADLSDGTLRFLALLTLLSTVDPNSLLVINEPETSLHPSMLKVVADYAAEAAIKAQVILATQSPELLDALSPYNPTVTVTRIVEGQTELQVVDKEELKRWLTEYTLGSLQRSGELEEMP